jgi:hypothetical protein
MGMTTAFLAERAVPRRLAGGISPVGVRTVDDLFRRLFP